MKVCGSGGPLEGSSVGVSNPGYGQHARGDSNPATRPIGTGLANARRINSALLLLGTVLAFGISPTATRAQPAAAVTDHSVTKADVDAILNTLKYGSFTLTGANGQIIAKRQRTSSAVENFSETSVAATLSRAPLTTAQAETVWDFLADDDNSDLLTLPVITAAVGATKTPKAREAMWNELAGLAKELPADKGSPERQRSLLTHFERHRAALRPHLTEIAETESSGDEMVDMLATTKVFGASLTESVARLSELNPAALARRMERERGRGKPVSWENTAFDAMLKWKSAHLVPGAPKAPQSLQGLDAAGETFATIFNALHDFDTKYRETMLSGLGPTEIFNIVVGGEMELYRMGTSSYRDHLHAHIMRGIKAAGSFEAFIQQAAPARFGDTALRETASRGMVHLRVVSSFGLLEPVLETVRDRERFINNALASLGDITAFERNSTVVMDILTASATTSSVQTFKRLLLDKLYARYAAETDARARSVYGSMLSVYQTISDDRRDKSIDRDFPLDDTMIRIPFDRLFSDSGKRQLVHRMFMRLDQDVDATATYASFRNLMKSRGASLREHRNYTLYRITARDRTIEIYANKPTAVGVRRGIDDIATALRGLRVETVLGRGHTSIVKPLQDNSKQILGARVKDVSVVLVGTCGGDASIREMIATYGHRSFVATRSTGRQAINNAFIEMYIASLLSLPPNARLPIDEVVYKTTAPFLRKGADEDLRDDATFYGVSKATVLTARLFEAHVRKHISPQIEIAKQ